MTITHELKIAVEFFEAKLKGLKPWELRFDDRGFKTGDFLKLREVRPTPNSGERKLPFVVEYTGRVIITEVTYLLRGFKGLADGYVIMSERVDSVLENDFPKENG